MDESNNLKLIDVKKPIVSPNFKLVDAVLKHDAGEFAERANE